MKRFLAAARALLAATALSLAAAPAVRAADDPARKPEKLTLAISSSSMVYGPIWLAMAENLFENNGVDLKVVSTNALTTGPSMLVSGHADLLATTTFMGLRIAMEGKPLSIVMNLSNMGGRINAFVSRPAIKSMADLAAMGSNCKVIVLPAGTAGWAAYQGIAAKYNLKCSVGTAGTVPLVLAGVLSGQFDAATLNPQDAYAARDSGKGTLLIDPLNTPDALAQEIYSRQHSLTTVFGMKSTVQAKKEAVSRFVRALQQANQRIATMPSAELGEVTRRLPEVFGPTPATALALQWELQKSLFPKGPDAGFISEPEWNAVLVAAPLSWGLANVNVQDPTLAYRSIVDMSYFRAAQR